MRIVALLLPIWVALTLGEHSVVHACPTHAAPAPVEQSADAHAHAGHAQPEAPQGDHTNHACSCIDACSTATVAPVSAAPAIAFGETFTAVARFGLATGFVRAASQIRVPWPNGPPALPS